MEKVSDLSSESSELSDMIYSTVLNCGFLKVT